MLRTSQSVAESGKWLVGEKTIGHSECLEDFRRARDWSNAVQSWIARRTGVSSGITIPSGPVGCW